MHHRITPRITLPTLVASLAFGASVAGCAAPGSVRALSAAQHSAIEELALAWSADHALARAELGVLIDIHRTTLRGRIHRELIATGCLTPEGDADSAALASAIADPTGDIALIREVRLGRMTEPQADAWLADFATSLRLGAAGDGEAVRFALLARLADLESLERAWAELQSSLDDRAERITALAAEAAGASGAMANAFEARLAWRTIAEDSAPPALGGAIDALFTDPRRRAAARELVARLLTPTAH